MKMRDELGTFFTDDQFQDIYPPEGQPSFSPWRLALVSIMQFTECLSDRQAADAVRARIDWKYALNLSLEDEGFDHSILCEFRQRLLDRAECERLLTSMLQIFKSKKLLKEGGKQRTDATHVLASSRLLNRYGRSFNEYRLPTKDSELAFITMPFERISHRFPLPMFWFSHRLFIII